MNGWDAYYVLSHRCLSGRCEAELRAAAFTPDDLTLVAPQQISKVSEDRLAVLLVADALPGFGALTSQTERIERSANPDDKNAYDACDP